MANDDSDPQKTPPLALPAELDIDNDNTDVMCIRCGRRMTCTVCEACDLHCLERDAVKCALLVVNEATYVGDERAVRAALTRALQGQKGLTHAQATAAADKLLRDRTR